MHHPSKRFEQLIQHVERHDDVPYSKKRHICSSLTYFKNQLLCDHDRRDDPKQIKESWLIFLNLMKGSELLGPFQRDQLFWSELEASIGIPKKVEIYEPRPPPRPLKAEDIFAAIASAVTSKMPNGPEKKLIQFGLWYLCLEARLARPFRSQERIELCYRYLHPHLKKKGFLDEFEGNRDVENMIKYFVKGSIL